VPPPPDPESERPAVLQDGEAKSQASSSAPTSARPKHQASGSGYAGVGGLLCVVPMRAAHERYDEASEWEFRGAVFGARQKSGKAFLELLRLLREDYPLTADDKEALADYLEAQAAPTRRGAPPQPMFSKAWHLQRIVQDVRRVAKRRSITLKEAARRVYDAQQTRVAVVGPDGPIERRGPQFTYEQILREVKRQQ
jgi:hypothetical protein